MIELILFVLLHGLDDNRVGGLDYEKVEWKLHRHSYI